MVVTDLSMSGIDGIAVARHARRQRPPIPVVLMTAYATREAERQAHSVGGTLYLAKPFACADLVDTVARARSESVPRIEDWRHAMTCDVSLRPTCKDVIVGLGEYLDAELTPATLGKIEAHLRACEPCRAFLATYRKTKELVARESLRTVGTRRCGR
jgi:CheY-like chemotaxis protein